MKAKKAEVKKVSWIYVLKNMFFFWKKYIICCGVNGEE